MKNFLECVAMWWMFSRRLLENLPTNVDLKHIERNARKSWPLLAASRYKFYSIGVFLAIALLHPLAPVRAQVPGRPTPPGAFVDFNQILGMPPYVFRVYQFAAPQAGKVRVEAYIGMVNDILQFVKMPPDTNGQIYYRAQYDVNVTAWDKKENVIESRNWKGELLTEDFNVTNDRRQLNMERTFFDLAPGEYNISIEVTDHDTGKNLRDRRSVKVEDLNVSKFGVSTIVLIKQMSLPLSHSGDSTSHEEPPAVHAFWETSDRSALRDSLQYNISSIVTNLSPPSARVADSQPRDISETTTHAQDGLEHATPSRVIGPGAYFEIYGVTSGETLQLEYEILDVRKEMVHSWNETLTVTQTPISHLALFQQGLGTPGSHTFRLKAKRAGAEASAPQEVTAQENFQIQPGIGQGFAAADFITKQSLYGPLRYVAKGAEFKRIAEADEAARDSLVDEFWQRRDPNPETEANALREEFYRRVAFADMRFAVPAVSRSGWETDRGRIYIVYGPPKEVHHQMADQNSSPYEIWLYPDQNLQFVFRDKSGTGDYELISR